MSVYIRYHNNVLRNKNLTGKFYRCFFNENTMKYGRKVHYHKIIEGGIIKDTGTICDGIALVLDNDRIVLGVLKKNILKELD